MPATTEIAVATEAGDLRDAIRALVRRFSITERADVSCCGMTVAQAATLEILGVDGPLRLGELGRRLGISPSTLTRNLRRLEEKGLLERALDPDDGRASRARLTPAGRRAAAGVERQELRFARRILDRLPPTERSAAVENLKKLLGAIREATESCCPGAYEHLFKE